MNRTIATNVRMPEDTYRALRLLSRSRGWSLAALIREALALYVKTGRQAVEPSREEDDPFLKVIGIGKGGPRDMATEHDHYLYGWPKRRRSGGGGKG